MRLCNIRYVVDSGRIQASADSPDSSLSEEVMIDAATSSFRRSLAAHRDGGHYYACFSKERLGSLVSLVPPKPDKPGLLQLCVPNFSSVDPVEVDAKIMAMLGAVESVAVTTALRSLQELGLLTAQGGITTPGRVSSSLQLTPVHTKALLIGVLLRCLYPTILLCCIDTTLLAALIHLGTTSRSLNDILRSSYPFFNSDQLLTVHAYENADQSDPLGPRLEGYEQSHQLVLTPPYTNRLRHQALLIHNALMDIGLLQKRRDVENKSGNKWKESEDHSVQQAFAKAPIFAALHDNLAIWDSKRYSWYDGDNERLRLPRSRVHSRRCSQKGEEASFSKW